MFSFNHQDNYSNNSNNIKSNNTDNMNNGSNDIAYNNTTENNNNHKNKNEPKINDSVN